MPLDPNFLSRIINVQWGGDSTTAAGTLRIGFAGEANYTYCCTMKISAEVEPDWKQTGRYVSSSDPNVLTGFEMGFGCMVYASVGADTDGKGGTPTFVAIGSWGVNQQPVRIMISNDGVIWTDRYSSLGSGNGYGVCWDETQHAFYAAYQDSSDTDTGGFNIYDVLLRSSTGSGWSEVSRKQIGGIDFDLPPTYVNPIINHGGDKVKDINGNYVTNAFWGYNKATKTLIYPDHPYFYWGASSDANIGKQLKIEREQEDGTKETTLISLSFNTIWAVTFAGGIWHAAGEQSETSPGAGGIGRIATSTDDGKTWKVTFEGKAGNPIASIASAPAKDFSS